MIEDKNILSLLNIVSILWEMDQNKYQQIRDPVVLGLKSDIFIHTPIWFQIEAST